MRCLRYLALVGLFVYLAWFGAPMNSPFGGYGGMSERSDYYTLLTEGYLSGHTWMNLPAVPEGHTPVGYNDTSFYKGHYYLYFGPGPVLLFLLPYKVLTGSEAPLALPILLSIGLGALLQGLVLGDARKRYFPQLCPWFEALLWILLACGSTCPLLLAASNIYETAVAVGYLCVSALWYSFYRALHAGRGRLGWLALASTAAGLAVASRPSTLLLYPALAAGGVWLLRRLPSPAQRWSAAAAAVIPSALIGAGLAAYNVARFGRVSEMGMSYQNLSSSGAHADLMSARYVGANLSWYYFRLPSLTPYFPFVLPMDTPGAPKGYGGTEWIHGQWVFLLLAVTVAAAALLTGGRRERMAPLLKTFVWLLIGGAGLVLAFLCCAWVRADRYQVDCQGSFVLAVAIVAGWAAAPLTWKQRAFPAFMVLLVAGYNLLTPFSFKDAISERLTRVLPRLERAFNLPSYWAYRAGLIHYGPRRLTVEFPQKARALIEPLVSTGSTLGQDTLESVRLDAAQEQFIFESAERGNVQSRPFAIVPGRSYAIDVDMGGFYPPRHHPFFDGWSPKDVERVKTAARVAIDGKEVIRTQLPFEDSAPDAIRFGVGAEPADPVFSGMILSHVRLPLRDLAHDPALVEPGLWKVSLEPLLHPTHLQLPIVGAGRHGAGILVLTSTQGDRRLAFGLDVWGLPVTYSTSFEVSDGFHEVVVFEGHQALATHPEIAGRLTAAQRAAVDDQLLIWWDGRLIWQTTARYFPDCFDTISLGSNPQQFSSSSAIYAGAFYRDSVNEDEVRAAVDAALAGLK